MLILTLTISAFDPEGTTQGLAVGDYSAVFPLLVVSVFVALMMSRDTVFYKAQRSRGDITALLEVLCEPGKAGTPMMVGYDTADSASEEDDEPPSGGYDDDPFHGVDGAMPSENTEVRTVDSNITQDDIELQFKRMSNPAGAFDDPAPAATTTPMPVTPTPDDDMIKMSTWDRTSERRLEELLSIPMETAPTTKYSNRAHRRTLSASAAEVKKAQKPTEEAPQPSHRRTRSFMPRGQSSPRNPGSSTPTRGINLVRVNSYGHVTDCQPSLIDQARQRLPRSIVASQVCQAAAKTTTITTARVAEAAEEAVLQMFIHKHN